MAQEAKYNPVAMMDAAAKEAEDELEQIIDDYPASDLDRKALSAVAGWWRTHYLVAGHKRLGRILLKY